MFITTRGADKSITSAAEIALRILKTSKRSLRLGCLPEVVKKIIALYQRFRAAENISYLSMVRVPIAIIYGSLQCYISRWDSSMASRMGSSSSAMDVYGRIMETETMITALCNKFITKKVRSDLSYRMG
jgi:hypothetical protein